MSEAATDGAGAGAKSGSRSEEREYSGAKGSGGVVFRLGPVESRPRFLRGDCNADGDVNLSDAVCILDWLFAGEATPGCVAATNTNGDDAANLTDATYLLNHLFGGGPAPVAPFPDCGPPPEDEKLSCDTPPEACNAP